jgi:conjugal transfer pilus assembly protein TraW
MLLQRLSIIFILIMIPTISFARTLGTFGATYPFAEKDALSEIEERAKKINWKKVFTSLGKKGEQFRPADLRKLPSAGKARIRTIDINYTLDVDVPDPQHPGTVLYPQGFAFNPLKYMTLPGSLVFFDASDRRQRDWIRSTSAVNDSTAVILITGGSVSDMERLLNRPVFYAAGWLIDRLDIQATPSIAHQKGESMEVEEFDVHSTHHSR